MRGLCGPWCEEKKAVGSFSLVDFGHEVYLGMLLLIDTDLVRERINRPLLRVDG
jgi:hypothetical protein